MIVDWGATLRDYVIALVESGEALPTVTIETKPCMVCGLVSNVTVDTRAAARWFGGELVQLAFPFMAKQERELLVTGTHPACWDRIFAEEER